MELGTFIASTVTMLITAWALIFTIGSFKKQMQLNFFADYTKRYQDVILGFPETINEPNFKLNKLSLQKRDKTLRHMRAYFDLCSEEYFLWRNGNLGDDVWKEWEIGIRFALSKPAFQQGWKTLRKDTIYQGEFAKFVESAIGGPPYAEWLRTSRPGTPMPMVKTSALAEQ